MHQFHSAKSTQRSFASTILNPRSYPRLGRFHLPSLQLGIDPSMETYAYSVHALWHRGPANRTCIEPMNEEVSGKSAGAGRQERYDRCWRLAHRGLSLLKAGRKGEDVRGNGRCGERRTKALLEVYRVSEDPGRKLKGIEWARQRKRRRKHGTFSAVPSSRRSKEQDAAMIAALLSDVV